MGGSFSESLVSVGAEESSVLGFRADMTHGPGDGRGRWGKECFFCFLHPWGRPSFSLSVGC